MAELNALLIGLDQNIADTYSAILSRFSLKTLGYDLEKLMEPLTPVPGLIICGTTPKEISLSEVAQLLRMQYQNSTILYVTQDRSGYDRKAFIKNGFNEAFLLPMDVEFLRKRLSEYLSAMSDGAVKSYRPVKLLDVEPDTVLDFDTTIYLPFNNKYIRYSAAGDPIDKERIERLKQHKVRSVYVDSNEMPKFYDYAASRLKAIGSSQNMSETERKEKLEDSVRQLVTNIFTDSDLEATFEQGQALVKDCSQIVKTYILATSPKGLYEQLLARMGDMTNSYSHSANVSAYASLFSIGLGIGNSEDLAIAGLLHDLGLAEIPTEILSKKEEERTREGQELYKKHPELSVNLIKKRKLIVSEKVLKAILQHHECYNGTGYPRGLTGDRICPEAQVLALADRLDELTSAAEGRPVMSPREAIEHFRKQVIEDPGKMVFNPDLLKKVLNLFPKE